VALLRPNALRPGSTVAVVAPASLPSSERIDAGLHVLEGLGYRARVTPQERSPSRHYLAGTDTFRAQVLTEAILSDEVDAVWCLRGGYGSIRTLDSMNPEVLASVAKPIIGFSDVTVLLLAMYKMGCIGLHGPVVTQLPNLDAQSLAHLQATLQGTATHVPLLETRTILKEGDATGPLVGGNLSIISSLIGTPWQPVLAGCILFLEDVGEPAYRLDRALTQLRLSGALDGVAGALVGDFSDMPHADHHAFDDVLQEFTGWIDGPVVRGLPCGHGARNVVLPIGASVRLDTRRDRLVLTEPALRRSEGVS
jgi:muramoyltetrapeptide carboxypeptidase